MDDGTKLGFGTSGRQIRTRVEGNRRKDKRGGGNFVHLLGEAGREGGVGCGREEPRPVDAKRGVLHPPPSISMGGE